MVKLLRLNRYRPDTNNKKRFDQNLIINGFDVHNKGLFKEKKWEIFSKASFCDYSFVNIIEL